MINKEEKLTILDEYLSQRGIGKEEEYLSTDERLKKYGLDSLASTRGILQDLHSYRPPTGSGLVRKIKNKIIGVARNVTISTVELVIIKQNKFNEITYQFLDLLVKENKELKEKIEKLESEINKS